MSKRSDAAHPCAEAPQRRHFGTSHKGGVFGENLLRGTEKDEDVHDLVSHEKFSGASVGCSEIGGDRGRGVDEDSVATVTHVEGDGLVHVGGFRPLRVCDEHVYFLSGLVEGGGAFSRAEDFLTRQEGEHGVDRPGVVRTPLDEAERLYLDLRGVVVAPCACFGQQFAVAVAQGYPPWVA